MTADMDAFEKVAAEFQCAAVLAKFFNCLDDRRMEELAALMAPDGVWVRQGRELRGPAMVLEAMTKRSPTVNTRHLLSNQELTASEADCVQGRFVAAVYSHDSGEPQAVAKLELPRSIVVFEAKLGRTSEGWRIAHLSNRRVFAHE
jgi:hypothetical protein